MSAGDLTVLFLRHGPAREGGPDPERPLSAQGREVVRAAVEALGRRGLRPARILASPFLRARETADILRSVLGGPSPEPVDWLLPWTPPARVEAELLALEAEPGTVLALVSHQPLAGALVDHVAGRSVEGRPASCSVLSLEGGRFRLEAHLAPPEPGA